MSVNPFTPGNPSTSYTASVTSGNVALPSGSGYQVVVSNAGAVVTFINFGTSAVGATAATSMALLPGVVMSLTIPDSATNTHMAAVSASSTAVIYLTRGYGE